jgi:hypothetical protein
MRYWGKGSDTFLPRNLPIYRFLLLKVIEVFENFLDIFSYEKLLINLSSRILQTGPLIREDSYNYVRGFRTRTRVGGCFMPGCEYSVLQ